MVINYKRLNSFTVLDGYFLPNKESLIKEVQEKSVFSKFDCKAGYGQIKMSEESISLTALITPQGQYKWLVMPFGLTNAPQIFQQITDNIFKQYSTFCQVYIYDIIVFNKNKKEHNQRNCQRNQKPRHNSFIKENGTRKGKHRLFRNHYRQRANHNARTRIKKIEGFPNKLTDKNLV